MKSLRLVLLCLIFQTQSVWANDNPWADVTNPEFAYRALYRLISGTVTASDTKIDEERSFVECGTILSPFSYLHLKDLPDLIIHLENDKEMEEGIIEIKHIPHPHLLYSYVNYRSSLIRHCGATSLFEYMIRGSKEPYHEGKRAHLYLRVNAQSEFRLNLINCGSVTIRTDVLIADVLLPKIMFDAKTKCEFDKEEE